MLRRAAKTLATPAAAVGAPSIAAACVGRSSSQFAPAAANVDARQLADAVQGLQLTAEQAHKVERVAHMLHAQLRLPRDDMLRLLPMILRAPVFVQNRLRHLRMLGLTNAELAHLVQQAPEMLSLFPTVAAPVLAERMQMLGAEPSLLRDIVAECPTAVPLLLRSRLTSADIQQLRAVCGLVAEAHED